MYHMPSSLVGDTRFIEDGLPLAAPLFLQVLAFDQPDDLLFDGWLASLVPEQFERILDSLARPTLTKAASAG